MTELIARRAFSPLYIGLDTAFLLLFAGLLLWKKKYMTVLVGTIAGILYMLVDYGIFHLLCNSNFIALLYQAVKIGVYRVKRYAAHRRTFF